MSAPIRIGNQTAITSADPLEPFRFALKMTFDAFEWFADRKTNASGAVQGWQEEDFTAAQRADLRRTGQAHDIRLRWMPPGRPIHFTRAARSA